jgi:phage gp46-like protein
MAFSFSEGDLKFFYDGSPSAAPYVADIDIDSANLYRDPGFETAVLISLFSDARADETDELPDNGGDRGGFWGSQLLGFELGSKLWLLNRSKLDDATTATMEQYLKDALQWMIDDEIASSVETAAVRVGGYMVNFLVRITRAEGDRATLRFWANWESQKIGGLNE